MGKIYDIKNLVFKRTDNGIEIIIGSFDINNGDFLLITGASGLGKSTLMEKLSGVDCEKNQTLSRKSGEIIRLDIPGLERKDISKYTDYELNLLKTKTSLYRTDKSGYVCTKQSVIDYIKYESISYIDKIKFYMKKKNSSIDKITRKKIKYYENKISELAEKYMDGFFHEIFDAENMDDFKTRILRDKDSKSPSVSSGQMTTINLISQIVKVQTFDIPVLFLDQPLGDFSEKHGLILDLIEEVMMENKELAVVMILHNKIDDVLEKFKCNRIEMFRREKAIECKFRKYGE